MAECWVRKKSVSFNTYNSASSFWILNGLVSSCFDKCDISDDESGIAKDIPLKPRVEAILTVKYLGRYWILVDFELG